MRRGEENRLGMVRGRESRNNILKSLWCDSASADSASGTPPGQPPQHIGPVGLMLYLLLWPDSPCTAKTSQHTSQDSKTSVQKNCTGVHNVSKRLKWQANAVTNWDGGIARDGPQSQTVNALLKDHTVNNRYSESGSMGGNTTPPTSRKRML